MGWWMRWRRRAALDQDLDRELRDHLERRVSALVTTGISEPEARRVAALEIGGVEQVKEAVRDVRGTRWAHELAQDVRYGARTLLRRPGLVIAATLSLGLGIGANTAIFSLVDAVLLRTLPARDPEALVTISRSVTNPIWEETKQRIAPFVDGALAWGADDFDLSRGGGEIDRAEGLLVSGGFFETLGVEPAMGRLLTAADDRRGGGPDGPTAVISHGFWQRRFGGDPSVLGRQLTVNRRPFTIVGVVPPRFLGPTVGRQFDIAVPLGTADLLKPAEEDSTLDARARWWLRIMIRMKPGQTIEGTAAALHGQQPGIRDATIPPHWSPAQKARYLRQPLELEPAAAGRSELRRQYREPLLVLLGIVGVVLLVACANVANLLLARGEARRHELSARLALGASHGRLVRQLLAESILLVVPGAIAGLALAVWGARLLVAQLATSESAVSLALPIDWRLLGFLAGIALATGIAFGLVPAWRVRRVDAADAMAHVSHSRVTRRGVVSGPLVVAQVALSLVLVVAAGLFVRTFSTLSTRDLGFDASGVVQASLSIGGTPSEARSALIGRLRDAATGVPGVQAAAISTIEPMSGSGWDDAVELPGARSASGDESTTWMNAVTPGWFATYRIPLVAGRDFTDRDATGTRVVIVNQAFVRRFFGGRDAVGQRIVVSSGPLRKREVEVVGVAGDTAYDELRNEMPPTLYQSLAQIEEPFPFATLTVRVAPGATAGLHAALTSAVTRVDPSVSLTYGSLSARIRDQLVEARTLAILSGFFGGLALLLAAIGLYGVTAYGVNERRREIGIRLTLGATRAATERLVLVRVATLVTIGIAVGLAASVALTPIVRTMLYQLEPRDPATMAGAAIALSLVGLVAGWLPARRAARLDPARVLREG